MHTLIASGTTKQCHSDARWRNIQRPHSSEDVVKLSPGNVITRWHWAQPTRHIRDPLSALKL
jgi:isocitrate lyase